MSRRRDTSWHAEFLCLVNDGLDFRTAMRRVGRSTACLHKHFTADAEFHAAALRARHGWLHGPAPDTSWHPDLPPPLAEGLSIPQAAAKIGRNPLTVRNHLRRFASLRTAVNEALTAAGRPPLFPLG
ncbi:hypothetical protein [Sphaerisporangium sp. NPDC051011]|uniref:hypothetical protein n=1 Tax=Sphaerisporangium sp. NPDC051011 TaxID=3155792 RepID=UPI00340BEB37